jgi:hypothetical protein
MWNFLWHAPCRKGLLIWIASSYRSHSSEWQDNLWMILIKNNAWRKPKFSVRFTWSHGPDSIHGPSITDYECHPLEQIRLLVNKKLHSPAAFPPDANLQTMLDKRDTDSYNSVLQYSYFEPFNCTHSWPKWRGGIASRFDDWLLARRPKCRTSNFHFSMSSRPDFRSTQPPIQCVPGPLPPGLRRPGCEADHSPTTSVEVKKVWSLHPLPHTPPGCSA